MLPDRVSNPGPLTHESGALPIALRGPASEILSAVLLFTFVSIKILSKKPYISAKTEEIKYTIHTQFFC